MFHPCSHTYYRDLVSASDFIGALNLLLVTLLSMRIYEFSFPMGLVQIVLYNCFKLKNTKINTKVVNVSCYHKNALNCK